MMRGKVFLSFVPVLFLTSSCEGELPAFRDPTDVLDGNMDGFYALSITTNSLSVYLIVRNSFDETFQGTTTFEGQAVVTSMRDPNVRKTFTLSAANIIHARSYNPGTRVLTIDPGDSIKLEAVWNFVDDNGIDLRQDFFRYQNDTTCSGRWVALPEIFALSGELKVFDRISMVPARARQFRLCHVSSYVAPNFCPPVVDCP